jgi:hypothetical protein
LARRPKEKERTQDNFRAAIQHWDFDCSKNNTPEAINEAEAALYDINSGSYDGWEKGERESRVAETVSLGLLEVSRTIWLHWELVTSILRSMPKDDD